MARQGVSCYGCLLFLDRPPKPPKPLPPPPPHLPGGAPEPGRAVTFGIEEARASEKGREKAKEPERQTVDNDDTRLLNEFFGALNTGRSAEAGLLLTEDAEWNTLYSKKLTGRQEIIDWRENERKTGRRNKAESPWVQEVNGTTKYKRDMKVVFPSKATHQVVQTVTCQDGLISHVDVSPKFAALSVALMFEKARSADDDEAALEYMSENVEWKAWDGFHVEGKEAVRKLFRQQKMRETKREGESEFEAANVNETGGVFERSLYIERVDGIKVKSKQRLYVKGELAEMEPVSVGSGEQRTCYGIQLKIVEVKVLATEEMIDGHWIQANDTRDEE